MKLLEDIIAEAIDEKASLAGMLRKCLVLAEALNAEELKVWANQELDGYDNPEMLPDYRKFHTIAKGNFTGPLGASIRNQPLPSAVLEPRHRHFCEQAQLVQPIAAYRLDAKGNDGSIDWPPNLTVKYQSSFYQGYALANAWQVIPHSAMAGMLDTIRTRILRFALEIKKQIGLVDENVQNIPQEKVNQTVTNIIYGGQNVIGSAARDIQQMGDVNISKGDLPALRDYLARVGVSQEETEKLEEALIADAQEPGAQPQVGERVRAWLGKLSDKGLKIGGEVGAGLITAVICKYLGVA